MHVPQGGVKLGINHNGLTQEAPVARHFLRG
jgi:hypothetical protein